MPHIPYQYTWSFCRVPIYHIVFSSVCQRVEVSFLEVKYDFFYDTEMKELGRSIQINTHNVRSLIRISHVCLRHLSDERHFYGERVYTDRHTRTKFKKILDVCSKLNSGQIYKIYARQINSASNVYFCPTPN